MSKFQVTKGIINNLNNVPYTEGQVYFVYNDINSENLDIYADIDGVRRKIESKSGYELPSATTDTLGGVKVGDGLSVEADGTLSANGIADGSITDEMLASDGIKAHVGQVWGNQLTGELTGDLLTAADAYAAPPMSLTVDGRSAQNGTPTPDAPVEIVSVVNPVLMVAGKNLSAVLNYEEGYLIGQSTTRLSAMHPVRKEHTSAYIPVIAGETYIFQNWVTPTTGSVEYLWMAYQLYDSSKSPVGPRPAKTAGTDTGLPQHETLVITIPSGVAYIRISARLYSDGKMMLEAGSTATAYEPYVGDTVYPYDGALRSLPDGTKDELHLSYLRPSTREGWAWYARKLVQAVGMTTTAATDGITGTVGVDVMSTTGEMVDGPTVLYKLATPVTTQLDPVELPELPAPTCTVWSDPTTGLTMEYVQDTNIIIDDSSYELPPATVSTLGGVKIGNGLSVATDGTLSSDVDTGMIILEYGKSTWADFLAAEEANRVVYCKVPSGTGQGFRMAFLAYRQISGSTIMAEFQYYRSISSHTDALQGDEIYVYTLKPNNTWTTTTRQAYTRVVAGDGLKSTYANGALTLNNDAIYELPPATTDTLGGVKVGDGLSVATDGTASIADGGVTTDNLAQDVREAISISSAADALMGDPSESTWARRESTGSGMARVESVQGASIVWNQIGRFVKWSGEVPKWGSGFNSWSITADGMSASVENGTGSNIIYWSAVPKSHKVYFSIYITASGTFSNPVVIGFGGTYVSSGVTLQPNTKARVAMIGTIGTTNTSVAIYPNGLSSSVACDYTLEDFQLFDLTAMFGAGNEPTTVAEFERMYPEPYYPYSAPTLKPVQIAGIASTDAQGGELDSVEWPTQTLRAAGGVRDELTAGELVTRVGVVDLGTFNWTYTNGKFYTRADYIKFQGGLTCIPYAEYFGTLANMPDKTITASNSQVYLLLRVRDDSYADVAAFKAAMSGVLLFYELATPTTTPISPALPMTYRVEQGGTESIIVPEGEISAAPLLTVAEGESAADVVMDALACIATPDGPVATANHAINAYLTMGGKLYKVTRAIASGEQIVSGTNVTQTTVMAELLALTN